MKQFLGHVPRLRSSRRVHSSASRDCFQYDTPSAPSVRPFLLDSCLSLNLRLRATHSENNSNCHLFRFYVIYL
uniref:Homeobox domain-containing protein n=1 Tax=Parascaris univalens TaxID=6257 RepID=A0A915CEU4_PARUN